MRKLVSQRERWQRVILETWWANRRMLFNPRYGTVGTLGVPFYLLSEIVAPLFEVLAVVTLVAGATTGLVDWWEFAVLTLAITFGNSALTTGALLMQDLEGRTYRLSRVMRFFALMPLELLVYRPIMALGAGQGHVAVPPRGQGHGTSSSATSGRARRERAARGADEGGAPAPRSSRGGRRRRGRLRPGGGSAIRSGSGWRPRRRSALALTAPVRLLVRRRGPQAPSRSRSTASGTPPARSSPRSPTASCSSRDGEICSVNRSLCELLGFERDELLGTRAPFPFWPPEHRHERRGLARGARRARRAHVASSTFRRRQGDRVRAARRRVRRRRPRGPAPSRHRARRLREPPPRAATGRARGAGSRDRPPRPPRVRGAARRRGPPGDRRAGRTSRSSSPSSRCTAGSGTGSSGDPRRSRGRAAARAGRARATSSRGRATASSPGSFPRRIRTEGSRRSPGGAPS